MPDVQAGLQVKTKVTLKKFDTDGPDDRTDEPFETVILEDGKIVEIIKNPNIVAAEPLKFSKKKR